MIVDDERTGGVEDSGDESSEQTTLRDDATAAEPNENDEAEDSQSDEDQGDSDATEFEFEHEGETFKLPAKLKGALLRQQDYTKKAQAVAQEREESTRRQAEIDDRVKVVEQVARLQQTHAKAFSQVVVWDGIVKDLEREDLSKLSDEEAGAHARRIQRAREQFGTAQKALNDADREAGHAATAEAERKSVQAWQACEKSIPNWSQTTYQKCLDEGIKRGYKREQVEKIVDPIAMQILNDARMYRVLMAKQQRAARSQEVVEQKPVRKVNARGHVSTGPSDNDDIDTWMKKEQKRVQALNH